MARSRFIERDGKRYPRRDILALRRANVPQLPPDMLN
jgi:hypothetical protein